jgi:hypothetical protein
MAIWNKCYNTVSTFTIELVFENYFLSAMAPYVYSRDGRSLSIYGSECQIWKTLQTYIHLKIWMHEIFFLSDILFTSCYFTCTCLVLEISLFGSIVVKHGCKSFSYLAFRSIYGWEQKRTEGYVIVSTVHRIDSLAHMLIVFHCKSSLIHFDKIKFLSQLHICIILHNLAFALLVEFEITLEKILASLHCFYANFISKEHFSNRNNLYSLSMVWKCINMISCNLNQYETMSMCTGCTDWKMQIPSALNQYFFFAYPGYQKILKVY